MDEEMRHWIGAQDLQQGTGTYWSILPSSRISRVMNSDSMNRTACSLNMDDLPRALDFRREHTHSLTDLLIHSLRNKTDEKRFNK